MAGYTANDPLMESHSEKKMVFSYKSNLANIFWSKPLWPDGPSRSMATFLAFPVESDRMGMVGSWSRGHGHRQSLFSQANWSFAMTVRTRRSLLSFAPQRSILLHCYTGFSCSLHSWACSLTLLYFLWDESDNVIHKNVFSVHTEHAPIGNDRDVCRH